MHALALLHSLTTFHLSTDFIGAAKLPLRVLERVQRPELVEKAL